MLVCFSCWPVSYDSFLCQCIQKPMLLVMLTAVSWKFMKVNKQGKARDSLTWPAKANPSARSEQANQVCKQIWNAAIGVEPSRAAIDADSVTQNVAAITRASNKKPRVWKEKILIQSVCDLNSQWREALRYIIKCDIAQMWVRRKDL